MSNNELSRHDHVLANLMFSLQAAAMQQLGKIQNPMSGEIEIDLEQAKATIDILDMLKVKCRNDTPDELLRLLDQTVMDLQLNYMDEMKKSSRSEAEADADAGGEQAAAADTDAADGDASAEPTTDEAAE